jgi:DNA topoisomerase IB
MPEFLSALLVLPYDQRVAAHWGELQARVRFEDPTTIAFEFRAKSGKEQCARLSDPRLATVVHACHELPGQKLFSYVDDARRKILAVVDRAQEHERLSQSESESATLLILA